MITKSLIYFFIVVVVCLSVGVSLALKGQGLLPIPTFTNEDGWRSYDSMYVEHANFSIPRCTKIRLTPSQVTFHVSNQTKNFEVIRRGYMVNGEAYYEIIAMGALSTMTFEGRAIILIDTIVVYHN